MANSEVIDLMQVIFTVAWVAAFVIGATILSPINLFPRRAPPLLPRAVQPLRLGRVLINRDCSAVAGCHNDV